MAVCVCNSNTRTHTRLTALSLMKIVINITYSFNYNCQTAGVLENKTFRPSNKSLIMVAVNSYYFSSVKINSKTSFESLFSAHSFS